MTTTNLEVDEAEVARPTWEVKPEPVPALLHTHRLDVRVVDQGGSCVAASSNWKTSDDDDLGLLRDCQPSHLPTELKNGPPARPLRSTVFLTATRI